MTIDSEKVKRFWDARGKTLGKVPFESIANLEQDPENLRLKIELETAKVFNYLESISGKRVLDLGAGVGQWAFRFIERDATHVTAVEYSKELAEIGRQEALRRGIRNIDFVVSPAQEFTPDGLYDVIYISGLFVYLNDDQAEMLVAHLKQAASSTTEILLRDGTGVAARHEINDRHSDHLQTDYSATYRTRAEYVDVFGRHGFTLVKDENMFEEDCPLNKYPETRLRVYKFSSGAVLPSTNA